MPRRTPVRSPLPRPLLKAPVVPLGAMAAGFGLMAMVPAHAQAPSQPDPAAAQVAPEADAPAPLRKVTVKGRQEEQGKETYKANTSRIGKGTQELRDIPQSVTVVTEKLLDDRNVDTLKEALHNTAGITFMAAEGGEEDIRLRGFSLAQTGDIFVDGVRDPAFYERDTFNYDRLELLRGSASMLFGRGSTGGAVNQVSKTPFLDNANEVSFTLGNHQYKRLTGDFNLQTAEDAALRLNVMATKADNNGAGSSIDKQGVAGSYRWKIGSPDEFLVSLYYLNNDNGINYGIPWIRPTPTSDATTNTLLPRQKPSNYYGMASDYNRGSAQYVTFTHTHRFSQDTEWRTTVRAGRYERNMRASTVRLAAATPSMSLATYSDATAFTRGSPMKVQDLEALYAQSDYSTKLNGAGLQHALTVGVDASRERRRVYSARSAAQGGVDITKPGTTAGTPFDGMSVDEGSRVFRLGNEYTQTAAGVYAQDLVQIAPAWKLLGGLRYDYLNADFQRYVFDATSPTAVAQETGSPYGMVISKLSHRWGVLFQPSPLASYYLSYGTSFNTSGDTYSVAGNNQGAIQRAANTEPEESRNVELGAKFDSEDGRFTSRMAVFKSTKFRERNLDQTTVDQDSYLLSGKRHATGFEIDASGLITPRFEVYGSYMWLPNAKIDQSAGSGAPAGSRPGLTPRHSGTVWATYKVAEPVRVGAGVNFRSRQSPADVAGTPWYVPGYATFDLMAEYAYSHRITFKANVNNVADKYYADSLYRGHYIPGLGRLVQLNATMKF